MKFVIANWKMNFAISQEFDQFFRAMSSELRKIENTQFKQVKIIFAPSFLLKALYFLSPLVLFLVRLSLALIFLRV